MNAEDLAVNDSSQSKQIEDLSAVAPYIDRAILTKAFIVEAVHLSDLSALVVATNQSDTLGIAHLQSQ